jgi:hypothetical protein
MTATYTTTRMPFGKHKGEALVDIPTPYLEWLLAECELRDWLLTAVVTELDRRERGEEPPPRQEQRRSEPVRPQRGEVRLDLVKEIVEAGRRALARKYHPDGNGSVGDSGERMAAVNATADWLLGQIGR